MNELVNRKKAIDEIREFQAQVTCSFSQDFENGMNTGFDYAVNVIELMDKESTIVCDDNFGFAGYIVTTDERGYRVEESWNAELNDEQMMCVMCGVIQDIKADERLTRLWMRAMDLANFIEEKKYPCDNCQEFDCSGCKYGEERTEA